MQCPKCGATAEDHLQFCSRCHATISFECPSCHHRQTHGGTCDQCGIDFLKYLSAIMSTKKAHADAVHERRTERSSLLKNILLTPLNAGFPLIRQLFGARRKSGD
jgi:hypothetical protein